ncbi:MAG TPA: hypothetical protein VJ948_09145 [Acidimicrobiia bacterium]|nr:hypothetical protein [Acidimicrobiia bacterium]
MICLVCHQLTPGRVCSTCRGSLRPAPERILPGGLRVVASYCHEAAARDLIHLLKYRGVPDFARHVAGRLAARLPPLPLVPVPRALSRRLRYGVDPSRILAEALSAHLGVPVLDILRPRMHVARRAGRNRSVGPPEFQARRSIHFPVVLVDDVVTTGSTLLAAARALGREWVTMAVVANSAPVPSLSVRDSP